MFAFAGALLPALGSCIVTDVGFARAAHMQARLKNFEVARSAHMKGDVVITCVKSPHAR